ncbi:MAG: hypothetical protein Q8K26_03350 [Candidatus Gracilibacteria bacterium]|nr:hypothetical protein [Candidatus Gracilibacteria bacterium]
MTELQKFAKKHSNFWWWVKDPSHLSDHSVIEGVFCYGDFDEKKSVIQIVGEKEFEKIFVKMAKEKRKSLQPETINYWTDYLRYHKNHA